MIVVRFNDVDEFLTELDVDAAAGMVQRKLLRQTKLFRGSQLSPNVRRLSIVATYLTVATHTAESTLVRLEMPVGDLWGHNADEGVIDSAVEIQARIDERAAELGMNVRAGIFEEANLA